MAARAGDDDPGLVARQAASALAAIAGEPPALVTACRRLVDRQPTSGPVWWLAARVLAAADPANEAWRSADALRQDPTPRAVADALADGAVVTVLGSPRQVGRALGRRGDVQALVVDARGQSGRLLYDLDEAGGDVAAVPESGLAAAVLASDVVVLEADALGPDGLVAVAGSRAAAAVAHLAGIPVWAVAGVGRVLPAGLWDAVVGRLDDVAEPWAYGSEVVPVGLVDVIVGPDGPESLAEALARAGCVAVPELTRR
jgi:translation initiation factor 2B subunit (eIF-2B alpha/beta/delta family)